MRQGNGESQSVPHFPSEEELNAIGRFQSCEINSQAAGAVSYYVLSESHVYYDSQFSAINLETESTSILLSGSSAKLSFGWS